MKIIFVTYCRAMFGANLCMLTMIKDLRERYGVEPLVIVPYVNDGELENELIKEKIDYIISPTKPWVVSENANLKLLRGMKAWKCNNEYANNLFEMLKDKDFDIVYSNNSTIQLGADLAKRLSIPHVWHVREFGKKDYNIVYSYPKNWVRRKFLEAAKVITISNAIDEHVKTTFGSDINSTVIYDGVEDDNIIVKENYDRENDICNFVCVGVLQEGKNQMELLQAGKMLLESGEEKFHIHIIGSGDTYEKKLRSFVETNEMQQIVTFHGNRNDVPSILHKMDAGVMCSKSEGFGRVTVEYMLAGLPVIGTANAGTAEIIENNVSGVLYKVGDTFELKKNMKILIEDKDYAISLGKNGNERADKLFTANKNTDDVYAVFVSVSGRD